MNHGVSEAGAMYGTNALNGHLCHSPVFGDRFWRQRRSETNLAVSARIGGVGIDDVGIDGSIGAGGCDFHPL